VQAALAVLLINQGKQAEDNGICVEVRHTTPDALADALAHIADQPCPPPEQILTRNQVRNPEKWDWVLPDNLFLASFASRALALEEAHALCKNLQLRLKADSEVTSASKAS
jgi:hypothetical protein